MRYGSSSGACARIHSCSPRCALGRAPSRAPTRPRWSPIASPRREARESEMIVPGTVRSDSDAEVLGLRVVDDDRGRGLLGDELVLVGEGDADALRAEEAEELVLVLEVGAGGVAEG